MSKLGRRIQHPPFVATEPKASFKGNLNSYLWRVCAFDERVERMIEGNSSPP
jgi:hypothetical protein